MLISIITACYNSENTIEETLKSVTEQTYKQIEYLIIDGKSSDKTLEIVSKYSGNISKIISEPDTGIYDALNKGIQLATGEIIGFVHADDTFTDKNVLEKVANLFRESQADAIYADLDYIDNKNPSKIIRHWQSGEFIFTKIKKGWMPPHPTLFVKKKIYEKYGSFDTTFKIASDYDIILRFLYKHKISVSYLPEVITKMRTGGTSNKNISNILKKMKEDLRALKKNEAGNIFTLLSKNFSKIPQLFGN